VSEKETNSEVIASTPSRRDVLKAGVAGATALGAASVLGPGVIAEAAAPKRVMRASKKTQLKLMSWEVPYEVGERASWTKVVNDFMAAHPSIQVTWTGWPFSTFDQNVIAQAQAGQVDADVVQCPPELASTLITNYNMCLPLGSIAKNLGLIPNAAHNQFMSNGQLYALGILEVAFCLQYDARILKQAGWSKAPTTPAEWLACAKAVTKPPNQFGVNLINNASAAADWWNQLQNWPLGFGGVWAKGKTLTINSPENVKAIQFWLDLLTASGIKGSSETALTKLYFNDQIAMNFAVAAGSATLKQLAPKLYPNLRSAAPPWPGKKAIARLHPMVVLKSSKNQDAAMELVKWCVQPKNLYYVTVQNGYPLVPYTNFAEKVPQYTAYEKALPWGAGFRDTNYVGEADILGEYTYAYAQIGNIICNNVEKAVSGSASVKSALDAAQSQASQSLHI
jgi:multiple sugar transport system substrate-binding protein